MEGGTPEIVSLQDTPEIASLESVDDSCQPLSRKLPIPSIELNLYRAAIVLRTVLLGFFFQYRITNPVFDGYGLWLTSVICEIWFAICWLLCQLTKMSPTNRVTYFDRLALRYEKDGELCRLAAIDIFVSTVDPIKEPPLVTANTVLSVLAVDYPADKVSCYVSDDGSDMLTFEALFETASFARKWVPFCKKYNIEPRAPEFYFARRIDYLKDKTVPSFVKERRAMKREYEEFKVRINFLCAKGQKVPEEGWVMSDGTRWPGNNPRDHTGMIQVLLGHFDDHNTEGNELPRLFYVSREKRPGFQHHKKAGAMNALLRVSAVLTNGAYVVNLDYDHYFSNSKALREAMCFLMDPAIGNKTCFVQFPLRFDDTDLEDQCANRNSVFFDIDLRCLDGIQGPVYVGSGCYFNRKALYGFEPALGDTDLEPPIYWNCCCWGKNRELRRTVSTVPLLNTEDSDDEVEGYDDRSLPLCRTALERHFGQSSILTDSAFAEQGDRPQPTDVTSLLKEAIHVISCAYEDSTQWGKEIGWIYDSVTGDIVTGFKMHARGWTSAYCSPACPAFRSYAPVSPSDRLSSASRHALGAVEILLSRHCPIWAGCHGRLKLLQRLGYVNNVIYPLSSIPLTAYCLLPAICLLTGKFVFPEEVSYYAGVLLIVLLFAVAASVVLELRWSGVVLRDWWRNEKLWVVSGTSACLAAVFQGLLKAFAGIDVAFSAAAAGDAGGESSETRSLRWTNLLVPPTTILLANLVGVVAGVSYGLDGGYRAWRPLVGKLLFAAWVVVHLQAFLRGLLGRQNRTPTIVIVWSVLFVSIFSWLWVHVAPFAAPATQPTTLVQVHM